MIPQGKGMYMWHLAQADGGDAVAAATRAVDANLKWVFMKAWDGVYEYSLNKSYLFDFLEAFTNRGIEVYLWGYLYGTWVRKIPVYNKKGARISFNISYISQAAQEARITLQVAKKYEAFSSGLILDPESEYKRGRSVENAAIYMRDLRIGLGNDYPIGLSTYRYPSYHFDFPWNSFFNGNVYHAQQMYWQQDYRPNGPEIQLRQSVNELESLHPAPFIPIGEAAQEGSWKPTTAQLVNFMQACKDMELRGVGFWSWEHAVGQGYWDTIADFDWGDTSTPAPPPPPLSLESLDKRVLRLEDFH